ncbi:hypothetical protein HF086_003111, partial [Spodoptera exigua]
VNSSDHVCQACWDLAQRSPLGEARKLGHCIQETKSPAQILAADSSVEEIQSPVQVGSVDLPVEVIQPPAEDIAADPQVEEVRRNQTEPTIVLRDYMRPIETERKCFIEACQRTERYRVPLSTRKMLLSRYKYYVPENNRLCDRHLVIEAWDFLTSLRNNYVQTFTAKRIQDMMSLKEVVNLGLLNFESIDNMEDHVVHTWIRLNKAQFHQMFNEVPQLLQIPPSFSSLFN